MIYAADIAVTSYERDAFLNHRQLECLFNSLFYLIEKRTSNLHINGSLWYESTPNRRVSLHKRPVMMKVFLVVKYSSTHVRNWHIFLIFVTAFSRFFHIYPHSYSRLRQSHLHLNKEQLKILGEQKKKMVQILYYAAHWTRSNSKNNMAVAMMGSKHWPSGEV